MGEIIIGFFFGILIGVCVFGVIDVWKQTNKIDDEENTDENSKR